MAHERQTIMHEFTVYVNCCENCPHLEERCVFKSVIDDRYDKYEFVCSKIPMTIENLNIIPIECPLPPRYST